MNYIKEINAFYDQVERNPLSASAVTLWHTLMHINNKARWVETFTVAAPVIRMKSGLKESSFKRARTELKEKGYIDFQSRSRNQAPVYRMVRLSGEEEVSVASRNLSNEAGDKVGAGRLTNQVEDEGMDHLADRDAGALIKRKENKKKQDKTVAADSTIVFFEENFGLASPYVSRELLHWVNNMGEQLVLHAMKRALDRGKTSWGYVRAILENWEKKGIRSVEEARTEEERFRRKSLSRKGGCPSGASQAKEEVIPGWFLEQKRKKKEQEHARETALPGDVDKETDEIKQMLANLG
ncbi:DnaD domain-containing protein [Virgibacillus oceani]